MTELLKDFIGAWGSRTKSHIFGSFVLAFLAVNWKVVYFLLFADVRAAIRISYFEANSDATSLYWYPLLIGSLLALGLPFLNDRVHKLVSEPINSMRMRDDMLASRRLAEKNEQELLRNETLKIRERKLIAQAITDQEIDDVISDPEKRIELQQQVDELRLQLSEPPSKKAAKPNNPADELSGVEIEILRVLRSDDGQTTQHNIESSDTYVDRVQALGQNFNSNRIHVETGAALSSLVAKKLVSKRQNSIGATKYYSLTAKGYSLSDSILE